MTVWETLLIYLVAPLGITVIIAIWGLTSWVPKHTYYKLGEKWTGEPVWWAAVDEAPWRAHSGGRAVEAGVSGGAASGKW